MNTPRENKNIAIVDAEWTEVDDHDPAESPALLEPRRHRASEIVMVLVAVGFLILVVGRCSADRSGSGADDSASIDATQQYGGQDKYSAPELSPPSEATASGNSQSLPAPNSEGQTEQGDQPEESVYLATNSLATDSNEQLLDNWANAEEMCRGSSKADDIDRWCPVRDSLADELNRRGMCYGSADDASAADAQWQPCR